MTAILITGANRGLGLALVQKFVVHEDPPALILATCRDPDKAESLQLLADEFPIVRILKLDVNDPSTFESFADDVDALVGSNGLNILLNNAGIHRHKDNLNDVTEEDYIATYQTNVIGPVFLTKALLPIIQRAADVNANLEMGMKRAAILNMSSMLGSVSLNSMGAHLSYRESKAALNTFTRSLSYELRGSGILVLSLHPGWVQTDLGGADAPLTIDIPVPGLIDVIYGLEESQQGGFIQWDGNTVPW